MANSDDEPLIKLLCDETLSISSSDTDIEDKQDITEEDRLFIDKSKNPTIYGSDTNEYDFESEKETDSEHELSIPKQELMINNRPKRIIRRPIRFKPYSPRCIVIKCNNITKLGEKYCDYHIKLKLCCIRGCNRKPTLGGFCKMHDIRDGLQIGKKCYDCHTLDVIKDEDYCIYCIDD